jgi:DNA-binding LacI/PurR family transcriptional regulator
MTVGLKDVAALAGVSIKTVSNVVNGQKVRPETLDRVQRAIDELRYQPNLTARNLRTGRTGVIALAVPELTSPYFAELARSIIAASAKQGWTVLVDETDGLRERELPVLHGIRSHLIDGAIFSPLALGREEPATLRPDLPMVLLGERLFPGHVDHVAFDNVAAAQSAVQHLLERGRSRIAAIGLQTTPVGETARLRLAGWRAALVAAGQAPDDDLIVPAARWHREDGYRATRELLASGADVDALFCCNDLLALGALRALAEAGLRVPEDVAVIGIDDIEESRYVSPSLTTISPDKQVIAGEAVRLLALRIQQRRTPDLATTGPDHHDVKTPFELIVREST